MDDYKNNGNGGNGERLDAPDMPGYYTDVDLPALAPSERGAAGRKAAKFAAIVGIVAAAWIIIAGVGLFLYNAYGAEGEGGLRVLFSDAGGQKTSGAESGGGGAAAAVPPEEADAPVRTTILVMGVNDGLADTMFLLTFRDDDDKLDIVSVPRDTKIKLPQKDVDNLHALGRRSTPLSGVMKINELHSYAGAEHGPAYVRDYLEEMLGVKIDYYVVISLKAFRNIVDMVGGVEIEVPRGGLHYDDPEQDLYIHLNPGLQMLDGAHAEQFVRFRKTNDGGGYGGGDVQRVNTQQLFMKEFFKQALAKEKIRENWLGFASTLVTYVKTDVGLDDIPKYIPMLNELTPDALSTFVIPGESRYENGVSYFFYDDAGTKELIDEIFYSRPTLPATNRDSDEYADAVIDYSINIELMNGSNADVSAIRKKLADAGYKINIGGDYNASRKVETRIMAKDAAKARQLLKYFKNAAITADSGLPENTDVVIITGTSEN